MSATPPVAEPETSAEPVLPSIYSQYAENLMMAFRAIGAALLGNSALIYFGFLGAHPEKVGIPLALGIAFIVVGCLPIGLLERDRAAKQVADKQAKES